MTQTPTNTVTDRILDSASEAEVGREQAAAQVGNPFERLYFTSDGTPTFEKPTAGVVGAIGANIFQSQDANAQLGRGVQTVFNSGAEYISGLAARDLESPLPVLDGNLHLNGEQIPLEEASIAQVYEALPPVTRLTLEQNGLSADTMHALHITNGAEFEEQWSSLVQRTRAHQKLESFAENASGFSKFAVAAGDLAANVATDPILILSAIFTGGVGAAARQGAKETAEVTLKRTALQNAARFLREGPTHLAGRNALLTERRAAARALFYGAGGSYGSSGSALGQAGHQLVALESGLQDASEGLDISAGGVAVGGVIGVLFGELSFRLAGMPTPPMTRQTYKAYSEIEDFTHHAFTSQERLGFRSTNEIVQPYDIESLDTINEMAKGLFNSQQLKEAATHFADDSVMGEMDYGKMAAYMLQLPTGDEALEYIARRGFAEDGLPETTYTKLTKKVNKISDDIEKLELAGSVKEAKAARSALRTAMEERQLHIENNLNLNERSNMSSVLSEIAAQVPVSAHETASARVARIQQISDEGLRKASENFRSRTFGPAIQKQLNRVGGRFLNIGQQARHGMQSDDETTRLISFAHGLIDDAGFDNTERLVSSQGKQIDSTRVRVNRFSRTHKLAVDREFNRITRGMDEEQIEDISYQILKHLGNPQEELQDELKHLAKLYRNAMDDLGVRGRVTGYLSSTLENFVAFNFNRQAGDFARETFVEKFTQRYTDSFSLANPKSPINYNALSRMGYATRDGRGWIAKGDLFDDLPTTVSDIPQDLLDDYAEALQESLVLDAEDAFSRLVGHHERLSVDPDEPTNRANRRSRPNPQHSRRIEQTFYLTDEMRDSGLVRYNISDSLDSYFRTTGYNILRDEALSEFYGQAIHYHDWVRAMERLGQNNESAKAALNRLIQADELQSGRFQVSDDGAVTASVLQNFASMVVNSGITPTIASTELASGILRTVIKPREIIDYVSVVADSIKNMKASDAKAIGIMFENEMKHNRFVGGATELASNEVRNNRLVRGTKALADVSRVASGERFFTTAAKSFHFNTSFSKLHARRNKLDRLVGLNRKYLDAKELRTAARSAGLDTGELLLYRRHGLLDTEMVDVMKKLTAVDKKAMLTRRRLSDAITQLSEEDRRIASELDQRMVNMALDDAESFVATPTANSRTAVENPLLSLTLGFQTFGRTFYNRAVTRSLAAPYYKQVGGFSFLISAEITNSVFRDILYNGHSVETVKESWEDNPEKNLALILSRLPIYTL